MLRLCLHCLCRFNLFLFCVCECFTWMGPRRSEEVIRSPRPGFKDGLWAVMWVLKPNPGPLAKQQVQRTTESSFWPHTLVFQVLDFQSNWRIVWSVDFFLFYLFSSFPSFLFPSLVFWDSRIVSDSQVLRLYVHCYLLTLFFLLMR